MERGTALRIDTWEKYVTRIVSALLDSAKRSLHDSATLRRVAEEAVALQATLLKTVFYHVTYVHLTS
jgi:hypothetical protein